MNGILNVYKEAGWTSFDVVAKLRGILKTKKIGHGGTLDPQVTGVLPVAVGKATRLLEYMEEAGKVYEGEVTIGFSTETEDAEGAVIERTQVPLTLSESEIDAYMRNFLGEIQQVPPMYSAVKVKGKRLYEYARAGQTVERPIRKVTIKEFTRTSPVIFENDCARFTFRVACSKGTYVRTLAVDLSAALGYAGHMSKLQRTAANGLKITESLTLEQIEEYVKAEKLEEILQPNEVAVSDLPRVDLTLEQAEAVRVGKKFEESEFNSPETDKKLAFFYENKLLAVYMKHPEKPGILKPNKVIN
ncbi:tRNA pseudouridine(55) synthase TruB [Lactococcus garvieae]|uniref:tRNA pseudouridine(55) synthase TruB n=1 Tax=Lactococcus garvieae TaxID=1363 RepID=UPI0018D791A3|nr:tRNA pseudouridine(55) synthase TruB [Lactococcus garvieae]QPS71498.1 tRNA pseudouridine(55) synthase TruB [Lactococcus garvieae]